MRKQGVTPELVALLNHAGQMPAKFYMADLYTFTLSGGAQLLYTNADRVVTMPAAVNNALRSEELDNASWTKTALNAIGVNALADPIGGTTMDKVIPNTSNVVHSIADAAITYTAAPWTHTFYTRASGYRWVRFAAQTIVASLDLQTGTVGGTSGGATVVVTDLGGGLYRWDITGTQSAASAAPSFTINNTNSTSQVAFAGDGTSGVGIWGFMAYPGTAFSTYLKTTSAAATLSARTFNRGPLFTRENITHKTGADSSTLNIAIDADASDTVNGQPLVTFVVGNGLDGATLKLERAFLADWALPPAGALVDFAGKVTAINSITRAGLRLTTSSWTVLLNVSMPPDVFQAPCLNTLFDVNCNLNPATFAVAGTVSAGATVSGFNTNLVQATGYFNQGRIVFTSGVNNGLARAIKTHFSASGVLTLILPLPAAPANGDTFTIYPGCGLTLDADCTTKFNNRARFRGMPFVPLAETAL